MLGPGITSGLFIFVSILTRMHLLMHIALMSKQSANSTVKVLTPKQERFCQEYVVDFNATQAAIRSGYTEHSAKVTAAKMLTNANIAKRVEQLTDSLEKQTGITKQSIIDGIAKIATAGESEKNRLRAWELLAKMNGLFIERHEVSGTGFVLKIVSAKDVEAGNA